jgi:hypothetical protein
MLQAMTAEERYRVGKELSSRDDREELLAGWLVMHRGLHEMDQQNIRQLTTGMGRLAIEAERHIIEAAHAGRKSGRRTSDAATLKLGEQVYNYQKDNSARWSWRTAAIWYCDGDTPPNRAKCQHACRRYREKHNLPLIPDPVTTNRNSPCDD